MTAWRMETMRKARWGRSDSIENYLEMGVPAGQYTQVREEKKNSLEWYEALFAAVAGDRGGTPVLFR